MRTLSIEPVPAYAVAAPLGAGSDVVVDYVAAGNADTVTVFPFSRAKLRLVIYALLMALDLFAAAAVWAAGLTDTALAPAQALLFGLLAPLLQAYGLDGLERPGTGAWRAAMAAATATAMAALLARAFGHGVGLVTAAAMTAALAAAVGMARRAVLSLLGCVLPPFRNDLILVDGAPSRAHAGVAVDAEALSARGDVAALNRLGHLVKNCDRVIVDAPADRHARWAALLQGADTPVGWAGDAPLARAAGLPLEARAAKRAFDLACVCLAFPVALPVMAALAAAIRLGSPGPILFRQWRVGRGNRQFVILKFRTMRHGAVDALGHRSAERGDGRTTRIGRFMRRTSLDELPQLFNVLAGSMSIVGPRPHPLGCRAEGVGFFDIDPTYARRHVVKPGLTGLAQVRGLRGATHRTTDLIDRLRADQEYIARWSLTGDVAIVARTLGVLIHPNAY